MSSIDRSYSTFQMTFMTLKPIQEEADLNREPAAAPPVQQPTTAAPEPFQADIPSATVGLPEHTQAHAPFDHAAMIARELSRYTYETPYHRATKEEPYEIVVPYSVIEEPESSINRPERVHVKLPQKHPVQHTLVATAATASAAPAAPMATSAAPSRPAAPIEELPPIRQLFTINPNQNLISAVAVDSAAPSPAAPAEELPPIRQLIPVIERQNLVDTEPLFKAAREGDVDEMKLLVKSGIFSQEHYNQALDIAAEHDKFEIVVFLREKIIFSDETCGRAGILAAGNDNRKTLKILFSSERESFEANRGSALMVAAEKGHFKAVKTLLLSGKISSFCLGRALQNGAENGFKPVIRVMLDNQRVFDAISLFDLNYSIDIAKFKDHSATAKLLSKYKAAKIASIERS